MTSKKPAKHLKATVIVTSDTCSHNPTQDTSGEHVVNGLIEFGFTNVSKLIIPDEKNSIIELLKKTSAIKDNVLIITVGGTGLCPRDVTPDSCTPLYDKLCPGIATALMINGIQKTPYAALSRLTSGIIGECLVVNFPGKLQACIESFDCLRVFLHHAIEQIKFDPEAIKRTHGDSLESNGISTSTKTNEQDSEKKQPVNPLEPSKTITSKIRASVPEFIPKSRRNLEQKQPSSPATTNSCDLDLKEIPYPMINYDEALAILVEHSADLCVKKELALENLDNIDSVLGETIATDIKSKHMIPPYHVSTMDGYVMNTNLTTIFKWKIGATKSIEALLVNDLDEFERKRAGLDVESDPKYFCYQVNTGQRVPEKDFKVIPVESTTKLDSANKITIMELPTSEYVRKPGEDLKLDDMIEAGTRIGPVELALILAMDHDTVSVYQKPRLAILSTGDELVSIGKARTDSSKVVDTNGPMLASLYKEKGLKVTGIYVARDDRDDIATKISKGLANCDLLVITGGASMGSKDYVKEVIESLGGTLHFKSVNIKPGKPVSFASLTRGVLKKYIFSLPGNPVSSYVTSIMLLLPFINYGLEWKTGKEPIAGLEGIGMQLITVEIETIEDAQSGKSYEFCGRREFLRAKFSVDNKCRYGTLEDPYLVRVSLCQKSSFLWSLKDCDCLVEFDPPGESSILRVGQIYTAVKLAG